jgi:hypothetical protein
MIVSGVANAFETTAERQSQSDYQSAISEETVPHRDLGSVVCRLGRQEGIWSCRARLRAPGSLNTNVRGHTSRRRRAIARRPR